MTQFTPDPRDVVLCTHPDTLDGWLAAWVVRYVARRDHIPVEFATMASKDEDVVGRNWIAFDQWPDASDEAFPYGAKSILVFDRQHLRAGVPLPYERWKRTFPYGIETMVSEGPLASVSNPDLSLCANAWAFFNAERPYPALLRAVNVWVMETNGLAVTDSEAIAVNADSYHRNFATLDQLVDAAEDRRRRELLIAGGQAILRDRALRS